MKTAKILAVLILALGLTVWLAEVTEAAPMGTAFTYQGHLYDANYVANGLYDLQFKLWMDPCRTEPLFYIGDVNVADVDVIDGYFTVELDFKSTWAFDGSARWLEIGVRPGELEDPNEYNMLSPRQEVTPTPYAINADKLDGASSSSFAWASHFHSGSDITSGLVGEGYIDELIARDSEVMSLVLAGDGSGSGLDADLLDGQDSADFAAVSHNHDGSDITSGEVDEGYIDADITRDTELTNGLATKAPISHDHDSAYVNVTGDTMEGDLILDSSDISVSIGNITISNGNLTATTIGNYGIKGITSCDSGQGVYGEVSGSQAYAVYGKATNSGNTTNFGGFFSAAAEYGVGVSTERPHMTAIPLPTMAATLEPVESMARVFTARPTAMMAGRDTLKVEATSAVMSALGNLIQLDVCR